MVCVQEFDRKLPSKGHEAGTVPVEVAWPGTVDLLKALRRKQMTDDAMEPTGLVFVDNGRPIHPDTYSRRFRAMCREAMVPSIRLHDARHSVATALHAVGVAPAHSAALLGHSTATHVATYITATQEGIDAAGAGLAEVVTHAQ